MSKVKVVGVKRERGIVLAVTTIGMVAFLGAVGLSVDISHLYLVSTELQNAADASALAAASGLNSSAGGINEATNRAVVAMNRYEFSQGEAAITRADVRFAANLSAFDNGGTGLSEANAANNPTNIRFVKVTVPPKAVGVFVARQIIGDAVNLTKNAIAGQSVGVNVVCNPTGLFLTQDDVNHDPLDRVGATCGSAWEYTPGCAYNLHMTPPCDVRASGYFVHNETCSRANGNAVKKIALGLDGCYGLDQAVQFLPHPDGMDVRRGVNWRFGVHAGGLNAADFPPDKNVHGNINWGQYKDDNPTLPPPPGQVGRTNRRVIIVPIVNASSWDYAATSVRIAKFAAFYLNGKVKGGNASTADITATYVGDNVTLGDAYFDQNGGAASSNLTVPVLYR